MKSDTTFWQRALRLAEARLARAERSGDVDRIAGAKLDIELAQATLAYEERNLRRTAIAAEE